MSDLPPGARIPLLLLGMGALAGGVLAGLARFGWPVPAAAGAAAGVHGALMISAFFGAVISLERAVAVGRGWAYLAPASAGAGGIALLTGATLPGQWLAVFAAATLVGSSTLVLRRLLAPFTIVLTLAAACWLTGNLLWLLSGVLPDAVPWWLSFLVLTIAGERLELTRFLPTAPGARPAFQLIVGLLLAGAALAMWHEAIGLRLFAAALAALAVWLMRYDIARRNARQQGLTRFIALCLLSGYGWLLLAGLGGLGGAFAPGQPGRDAVLHAVGLGFVFAMVFGHAPIILPAVSRIRLTYHPALYVPLLLLHLSLAARIAGDFGGLPGLARLGALANALTLLLFVATLLWRVARSRKSPEPT